MKVVVITGSTRGIGYGLAEAFLEWDCAVVISGRTQPAVDEAIAKLSVKHDPQKLIGYSCDVRIYEQVQQLWDRSKAHFGHIDYWINNAGIGTAPANFWQIPSETTDAIVDVNVKGLMHGCQVAIQGMENQGFGFIYNMEGLGSDGRHVDRITTYGTTKCAIAYFTKGLGKELKNTPVSIGSLSPGMVITDLLMGDYEQDSLEWVRAKKIFNILSDRVATVTPWLVDQMLSNKTNGKRLRWLTTPKIIWRFMTAGILKRDPFVDSAGIR